MTPTVSMRPNVSDRFRETLFVDRFHGSRPIGKRETETVAYWRGRASSLPPTPCLAERSQDALLRLPAGPEWLMVGRLPLRQSRRRSRPDEGEGALQRHLIKLAEAVGWRADHPRDLKRRLVNASGRGFPDLVLARPPRLVAMELKSDGEHPRDDHEAWLDAWAACSGAESYAFEASQIDEAERVLTRRRPSTAAEPTLSGGVLRCAPPHRAADG